MNIPLRHPFGHSSFRRSYSDSIIVKVVSSDGIAGFGEGVARPYVTGETTAAAVEHIRRVLLPAVMKIRIDTPVHDVLEYLNTVIPSPAADEGVIAWNAARTAVETALLDCYLKTHGQSLSAVLPRRNDAVHYSLVIGSGAVTAAERTAWLCRLAGITDIKIKVGGANDLKRIATVRKVVGGGVSIRLDANGAFDRDRALAFIDAASRYDIACIEQPQPRGAEHELADIMRRSPVPVMADESLVTIDDARRLIERQACGLFNVRVSKCGGIYNALQIIAHAEKNGIDVQLGCMVGETSILSAVGRHMAFHIDGIRFLEGSYGTFLLQHDIATKSIRFGWGGAARPLSSPGLGCDIREQSIRRYSRDILQVV